MTDWMDNAACKGMDASLFYPGQGESVTEAKQTCMTCPVRSECREHALNNHETYGVWGGLSERQRKNIRWERRMGPKPRQRPPCGTMSGYRYHVRHLEPSCRSCLDANQLYQALRREARQQEAEG